MRLLVRAVCVMGLAACARGEPPSPASASASVAPLTSAPARAIDAGAPRATDAGDAGDAGAGDARTGDTTRAGNAGAASRADAATAVDPAKLPQTREKPEASGAAWDARVDALWSAIVADDPDRALPFFFPLGAYEQVKAIANPAADWRRRLVAAYSRDIHELHAKLGAGADGAKLERLEPGPAPRWVDPGEEYNKIGYWRVFGSKLRFSRADGKSDAFDVKSLISWRGEWYVVHLSAIK